MSGTWPSSRGSCHGSAPPTARAALRDSASEKTGFFVSGAPSLLPFTSLLTHSTPPERKTSPSPDLIAWYAIRVDCSEDEQYLLIVVPGSESKPSMIAATR